MNVRMPLGRSTPGPAIYFLPNLLPPTPMEIALLTIDIHLPNAHSLKEKRKVIRQLKDQLRAKFNVSIAEVGDNGLWQRSQIAAVTVSADHVFLEKTLSALEREAEKILAENEFELRWEFL